MTIRFQVLRLASSVVVFVLSLLVGQEANAYTIQGSSAPTQFGQAEPCTPRWLPTFGGEPGTNGTILAMAEFDDGSGSSLYVAGDFTTAGGQPASMVAKLDGSIWVPLGSGLEFGRVNALTVFDDGSGDALFAAGSFGVAGGLPALRVAKWNGSDWTPLGSGMNDDVSTLEVFDDGTGAKLYAGGKFTTAGGVSANRIASWDGSNWSSFGSGMDREVKALRCLDDGSGATLYAGGSFSSANGVSANGVAKWAGAAWSALGAGITSIGVAGDVCTLEVFDDGGGLELYVGGAFGDAGGLPARSIAKWDGSNWSALPMNPFGIGGPVTRLRSFDDGTGMRLYVAGAFGSIDYVAVNGITTWDGSAYASVGGGISLGVISDMIVFDDGVGEQLFVGGEFGRAGSVGTAGIAKWNGANWSGLGAGLNNQVNALAVVDDGGGKALFAAGGFTSVGGLPVNHIAKWNGSQWAALGEGLSGSFGSSLLAVALAGFNDGTGEKLVVGGDFRNAGANTADRIAQWDGSSWAPLGSGVGGLVRTLGVFDEGNGDRLFVGGQFADASGVAANGIARWDGSGWAPLGLGLDGHDGVPYTMTVFDDGSGDALYVGGSFLMAGGTVVRNIARWDGANWTPLGLGVDNAVFALAVFDDGSGEKLFAAGSFANAGGVFAPRVARWDGAAWSPLGGPSPDLVRSLAVFDDGNGERLFAGGSFTRVGGMPVNRVAKWDGTSWTPLGNGAEDQVFAMSVLGDGGGEALYVGGRYSSVIDSGDSYLAKWGCESSLTSDLCSGDGGNQMGCTDCPCSNNAPAGTSGGCLNSAGTGSRLMASGDTSVSLDPSSTADLRFTATAGPAFQLFILNSGNAVAPGDPMNPCFGLNSGAGGMAFDGLRCAIQSTLRNGGRGADSNGEVGISNNGWGGEFNPPGGIAQFFGYSAGTTKFFQCIYRDSALVNCMTGLNTTQAIEVTLTP